MAGLQTWLIGPKNASSNVVGTPVSDVSAECMAPGDDPSSLLNVVVVVDPSAGGVVLSDLSSFVGLGASGLSY
jgi:hypothetical protein